MGEIWVFGRRVVGPVAIRGIRSAPPHRRGPVQTKVLNAIAGAFVVVVVVGLGAHAWASFTGGDGRTATASSAVERGTVMVQMKGLAFPDGVRTVAVGAKVVWTNVDDAAHTVTATDKSYDSGSKAKGQSFEHTYTSIGRYDYYCTIHPFMKGSITVVQPYGG
jgi:plastocyanin